MTRKNGKSFAPTTQLCQAHLQVFFGIQFIRLSRICLSTFLVLFTTGITCGQPDSQTSKIPDQHKKTIVWGGLDVYNPQTVSTHIRQFEELPFDGLVMAGFKLNKGGDVFDWRCFGTEQFERADLTQTIEILKGIKFKRFTDNFLRYNLTPGVDWFDNFDAVLHNAQMWAEVTKETGMRGWALDVEDYSSIKGTNFTYKKKKYARDKTFDEYARQAQLRGRQFMEAIQKGDPDIVILLTLAHSYVNRTPNAAQRLAELDDYGLLPAFVNGMIEGAGPHVKIINGQEEAYGFQTPEEFFQGYHSVRQDVLSMVPEELWGKYRQKMDVGVAVYVNLVFGLGQYPGHWPTQYIIPEDRLRLFEQDIYYALKTADEYVWVYSESMSYWEPGARWPTPQGMFDAIRSAQKKICNGEPLGFDMTDRVLAARQEHKEASPYPSHESILLRISGKTAPVIDGILNDDVWKSAPLIYLTATAKTDTHATVIQAAFDEENLYFAFCCAEPEPNKMRIVGIKRDDNAIWKGECAEIYLMASEGLSYHFIINPNNIQWDGRGDLPDWNTQWRSGTRIDSKGWTAEIAIPWSAIGGQPASRCVRAFLCRRRAPSGELCATVQNLNLSPAALAK